MPCLCFFQVPPEQFCDIIWAGDLHYKDHQCDFLAAYVAVCYTHQVCINWRRHNFCRKETQHKKWHTHSDELIHSFCFLMHCNLAALRCPPGKEYQPCVSTCTSRTCLNRDYYEETTCSFIREECVCRSGTILHRADSPYCVTEDRCGELLLALVMNTAMSKMLRKFVIVFVWFCCIQCAQIMRVTPGPQARCGMALLGAAVSTSVWKMALWWLWNQTAAPCLLHCVRERESMCWMCWKKEPAAQRRSVVSCNCPRLSFIFDSSLGFTFFFFTSN